MKIAPNIPESLSRAQPPLRFFWFPSQSDPQTSDKFFITFALFSPNQTQVIPHHEVSSRQQCHPASSVIPNRSDSRIFTRAPHNRQALAFQRAREGSPRVRTCMPSPQETGCYPRGWDKSTATEITSPSSLARVESPPAYLIRATRARFSFDPVKISVSLSCRGLSGSGTGTIVSVNTSCTATTETR